MKTKLVKSMMASLVVACASLTMIVATATGQGTQGGTLQGTWEMQITLTDCAGHVIRSFPSLIEYASRLILRTSSRAGQSLRGQQPWIRQETPMRDPQPSKSITQTASYLQLYVLRLLARDSSSNRLRGLACDIRARQTQPGQRLHHEESTAERQRALDDPDRSSRSASSV